MSLLRKNNDKYSFCRIICVKMMRKKIFLFLTLCLLASQTIFSQSNRYGAFVGSQNRFEVKFNSLILLGIINPAIELYVYDHTSIQLETVGIFCTKNFMWTGEPLTLATAFLEYRYYFHKRNGFFIGPNAGYGVFRMSKGVVPIIGDDYDGSGKLQYGYNMMVGLNIGYKYIISKYCSVEICFSPGYQSAYYEGFTPEGGMYVGIQRSGEFMPLYKGGIFLNFKF